MIDITLRWSRRVLLIVLILMLTGMMFRALGPPHPMGYTCWYDEHNEPQCSIQPPGWMYADQA